ncbi:35 member G1 [Seminavis robusta]|uniref:35 member G1 n=1 Tax=Seminavis robusta TaxID=568900 RepID=A0A9N8F0N7_9STRA|nr:35 member G1 [Seminavis robusta]|eukprot:Sro2173_g317630.1 35 member G1 (418) ;mRNA; r:15053-16306
MTTKEDQSLLPTISSPKYSDDEEDSEDNRTPLPQQQEHPYLVRTLSLTLSSRNKTNHAPGDQAHSLVGIILIMLGSFSFSCMFLFVKLMQGKANSFTVAFYRALVEIPIALWLCHKSSPSGEPTSLQDFVGPPGRARRWLLVRGGMGGAAVLCFFYAIQHLSLPDAVTLQFTTPPFAAAFAVCFAGEQWKGSDMIGAVVCLLGVMLIAHPTWLFGSEENNDEATHEQDSLPAIAVALLGAAFAGLAYMSVRMIGRDADANVMVLYYSCLSLPMTLLGSKYLTTQSWNVWAGATNLAAWDWCWMLCTGLTAYAGQYLVNLGLQYETAATGTLATCSQIVFTYVFEILFLHEPMSLWSFLGTLLIIGFMLIVGILKLNDAELGHDERIAGEPEELAMLFSLEHQHHPPRNDNNHPQARE